ncbi:MAG: DHHW family protein [bacterium]|nr:DHHW family protein [bacterium]
MEERKTKEKRSRRYSAYQALPFIVLLGMLVFFSIWQIAAKKRTYSVSERRLLAGKPVLTKESLLDASYMNAYEEYLTDQFPMRDQWITMKTYCGMLLGRRESGGVYIARDNSLIELHMRKIAGEETAGRNEECLIGFLRDMEAAGVEHVRVMLVPTADGIWREKLSPYADPFDQQAYLARFYETLSEQGLSGCYVDVWEQLAAHAGEQIYYKTDHHWTMRGAYLGYAAYAASLSGDQSGIPEWSDYRTEVVRTDFHGTTAAKCGLYNVHDELVLVAPPEGMAEWYRVRYDGGVSESDSLYERKHVYGDDPYSVYLDGNHAMTEIFVTREHAQESGLGAEARRQSILVIKDSYANCFVPYLTGIYDEITVIDPRYYNGSLRALEEEYSYTDVLILYNLPNFLTETTVYRLEK